MKGKEERREKSSDSGRGRVESGSGEEIEKW